MDNIKILSKSDFRNKIAYFRLLYKYEFPISIPEIGKILKAFDKMISDLKYENSLYIDLPISKVSFKNMIHEFIPYLDELGIIEKTNEYDENLVANIVETCIYSSKMYYFCTLVSGGNKTFDIEWKERSEFNTVKRFYTLGYTTILDLAIIFANNNSPEFLPGFGPKRFEDFQKIFYDGSMVKTIADRFF